MRVGSDHHPWNGVIGSQGIGKCNSNVLLVLQLCSTYNLVITNSLFHLPTCKKTSCMHLTSKHWHMVDYIITRKKDIKDIRLTKAICGADCWTDHRLILSKVNLKIAPKRHPQGKKVFRKLDMSSLKHEPTVEALCSDLDKKLENLTLGDALVEDDWTVFKGIVYSTVFENLRPSKQHNQDWFNENDAEITSLIAKKIASRVNSKVIPTQPQRKQCLPISTKKCKAHCVRCGMSGLAKRQMKFRAMLISMAKNISTRH